MKLWLKQTLIILAVIMMSVSLCLYLFVAKETNGLIQQAIQNGKRDMSIFCDHLSTMERTLTVSYNSDDIEQQTLIQYTFSSYAQLLQSGGCAWSLVMDDIFITRRLVTRWPCFRSRMKSSPPAGSWN